MSYASCEGPSEPAHIRWLFPARVAILTLVHLLAFSIAYNLAFLLRFDFLVPAHQRAILVATLPWVAAIKLLLFWGTGNFFGWWRYVTFADLAALLRAAGLSALVVMAIDYLLIDHFQIPRSILLLDFALTVLLFGGLRSSIRFSRECFWPMVRRHDESNSLFVGADEAALGLATQIHKDPALPYRVVGFLDRDEWKRGTRLGGIPVVGGLHDLARVARKWRIRQILVTAGELPGTSLRELMKQCGEAQLELKVIPTFRHLLHGSQRLHVRDVNIEDLLGRDPVQLDSAAIGELVKNKRVLVTGAGGSIGSEICRQVLKFRPSSLILVEQAENGLFHLERELKELNTCATLHPCIADILDQPRMRRLFDQHQPDVVFHAAAHKHVPLMEQNPGEAIKNNIQGTRNLATLAHDFQVGSFVFISTDKAVKPTSVMGATKQLAERYVHAISQQSATRFVVVRFGNVLGSAGSVVPLFQEQIRRGGPVTITDERMTRYFMTIPEAAQLVLQAGAMGKGGEIFVLDMGQPVKIIDLARDLIRLSGYSPDDIEVEITGMRPGEKLYEELYFADEQTLPTSHPKLFAAYHRPFDMQQVERELGELTALTDDLECSPDVLRKRVHELVSEVPNGSELPAPAGKAPALRGASPLLPAVDHKTRADRAPV